MKSKIFTLGFLLIALIINAQDDIYLTSVLRSSIACADYDNDSWQDILLTGRDNNGNEISKIYKNINDGLDHIKFEEQTQIQLTGVYNGSVAWADYDNDGWQDFILTGYDGTNGVSKIYKNDQNGNFIEQTQIILQGVTYSSVAWADYDKDGWLDILLTGIVGINGVSKIYKNDQNGNFIEQTQIVLQEERYSSVAWGDYDNDGWQDILLTGFLASKIYKNDQNGNFIEQTQIILEGVSSGSVAWADYNNDGWLDILLTGGDDLAEPVTIIYRNDQNGNFIEQTQINLQDVRYSSVVWGDYDNDGWQDIFLTGEDYNYNAVTKLYRNNQNGNFIEQTQIEFHDVDMSSVVWVDLDNNGLLDIVLTGSKNFSPYPISSIYFNTGKGFQQWFSDYYKNYFDIIEIEEVSSSSVTWTDYDNDGWQDFLLTGYDGTNEVSKIYKNDKNGNFEEQTQINLQGLSGSSVAWADYDNDGWQDIILTGYYDSFGVSKIYKNDKNGNFEEQTQITLQNVYLSSVAWADYDNDGWQDILLTGGDGFNQFSKIYKNDQNGNFIEQTQIILQGVYLSSIAWADYDNDGWQDILLTGGDGFNQFSIIYKNDQNGNFIEQTHIVLQGVKYGSVAWKDYDNDGWQDILLTGDDGTNKCSKIYKNDQNGNFIEQTQIILTGVSYSSVNWADYNNDGWQDILLTGDDGTNRISKIYKNDQNGNFIEQTQVILQGVAFSSVAWNDYNNDGWQDILLTGDDGTNRISKIYKNDQNGNFVERIINNPFTKINESDGIWVDFDKNTYYDLVLSGNDNSQPTTEIYENYTGVRKSVVSILSPDNVELQTFDYNNDGYSDLIITGKDLASVPVSKIYKNTGNNNFINSNITVEGVYDAHIESADYNNDGLVDFVISGKISEGSYLTKIYINNGDNNFEESGILLSGSECAMFSDFNNDSNYDLATLDKNGLLKLYRNINNEFEQITSIQLSISKAALFTTDYNSDGLIDIIAGKTLLKNNGNFDFISDQTLTGEISAIFDYNNDGQIDFFSNNNYYNGSKIITVYETQNQDVSFYLPGTTVGNMSIGDWDNDHDIDYVLTGLSSNDLVVAEPYYNLCETPNTPASQPPASSLKSNCSADTVFISWSPANDIQTPQAGLTYNCYMYEIDGDTIWHSLSVQGVNDPNNGKRYIVKSGNVQHNTSWFIHGLDVTKEYAWSVQAIDNTFEGGKFAPEDTFRLAPAFIIQPIDQTVCEHGSITFNTSTTPTDSYQWYRFTGIDTVLIQNNEYFSNATSPNLTISNATLNMHGYDLRCAATTVGGITFSNPAILCVDDFIVANAGTDTIICGNSLSVAANLPVNATGEWSCSDVNVTFGTVNSNSTLVSNLPDGNTTITWTLTQNNVCGQNSDEIIITSEAPLPQASQPTGETNCVSGTLIYETNYLLNADSYTWQLTPSNAGTITGNDVTGTINYNADFYGTGSIRVAGINSCIDTVWSLPLNFTITPTPEIPSIPTGATNLCKGTSNTNYTTTTVNNATSYQWELLPSAAGSIEGTGTSVSVTWNATFFGTASIKVKAIGCTESNWSEELIVNISEDATVPATPSSPSGNMNLCKGATSNYSINALSNARSYLWEVLPIEAGSISGDGTNSLLVLNEAYIGTASIKVKGANTCGEGIWSPSIDIEIIEAPQTPDIPVGETNLCKASANTNYAILTINNASSYNWELLPSSAGSIEGSGINASVIWNSTFYGNASLKVKAIGCSESNWSEPLNITVNQDASPPGTPTSPGGNINLCKGSSSNYNINALSTAISYIWEILPVEAGSITGDDINAVLVLNETYIGPAAIKAKGINTCGEGLWSSALDISISPAPSVAEVPTGETLLCKGKNPSTNYSVTDVSDATFYIWELLPSSAGSVEGSGNNISVIWNAVFSGEASIKVAAQGCESGGWSEELPVTIFGAKPDKLQVPIGSNNLCINSNNTQYQAELNADVLSYDWQISNNAGIITNNNSSAIVDWEDTFYESAGLRVRGINTCDTSDWSDELLISIKNIPEKADKPQTDKTELCVDQISSYAIPSLDYADYYSWEVYPSLAAYANGTTSDITIDWLGSYKGDAYIKVKGVNECGEGLWSDSLLVVINSPNASDIIEKSNYVLICPDSGYSYQWYLNGNLIIGATKKYYYHDNMPEGNYQVEITDSKGCSTLSENLAKRKLKTSLSETVFIYPNPTSSVANIEIDNDYLGEINLKITNSKGLTFKHKDLTKSEQLSKTELGISDLQPGSYLFEFNFNGDKVIKQIIVN